MPPEFRYQQYADAIATRDMIVLYVMIVVASALLWLWVVRFLWPRLERFFAWVLVGGFYATMVAVVAVLSRAGQ